MSRRRGLPRRGKRAKEGRENRKSVNNYEAERQRAGQVPNWYLPPRRWVLLAAGQAHAVGVRAVFVEEGLTGMLAQGSLSTDVTRHPSFPTSQRGRIFLRGFLYQYLGRHAHIALLLVGWLRFDLQTRENK